MVVMTLALAGCTSGDALALEPLDDLAEPIDECALSCLSFSVTAGSAPAAGMTFAVWVDGRVVSTAPIDDSGEVSFCPESGAIAPQSIVAVEIRDGDDTLLYQGVPLDVRPFGFAMGRDRAVGAPAALAWMPELEHAAAPFFEPDPDSWYAYQVTSPHRVGDGLLLFAGNDDRDFDVDKGTYLLGAARLTGDKISEVSAAPILATEPEAWDALSQNGPTALEDDGGYVMWYHGRADADEVPVLGRATSADGLSWTADPDNPILGDPHTDRVAHPTARRDGALIELWYLGQDGVTMALSEDEGRTFTPYCGGDMGFVGKTPEVLWTGERYALTWVTGDPPAYRIHWSESYDGIRWRHSDDLALEPTDDAWQNVGVANGQLLFDGDALEMVYVGVGEETDGRLGNGFGVAAAL